MASQHATVMDARWSAGSPAAVIEQPTHTIPCDCYCSWTVVRPAPGKACISRLSRKNNACPHRHQAVA